MCRSPAVLGLEDKPHNVGERCVFHAIGCGRQRRSRRGFLIRGLGELGGFYRAERDGQTASAKGKILTRRLPITSGDHIDNYFPAEPWPVSLIGIPVR